MKNFSKISLIALTLVATSSCALVEKFMAPKPLPQIDYLEGAQKMDIKKFFDGDIAGFAIKQGENGKIIETQSITVSASWDENKGVIKKNAVANDGTKDIRTWLITVNSDGTFDAVGHDVASPAKGKQIGNAAQSFYSLMVNDKSGREEVEFEERMYLVSDDQMMMITNFKRKKNSVAKEDNRSFGKVITSFRKVSTK